MIERLLQRLHGELAALAEESVHEPGQQRRRIILAVDAVLERLPQSLLHECVTTEASLHYGLVLLVQLDETLDELVFILPLTIERLEGREAGNNVCTDSPLRIGLLPLRLGLFDVVDTDLAHVIPQRF